MKIKSSSAEKQINDLSALPFYLTTRHLAELFHCSEQAVRLWKHQGKGPPYAKVSGGHTLYKRDSVLAWMDGQERGIVKGAI